MQAMHTKQTEWMTQCSDEQLVAQICENDVDAFEIFYDRHAQTVLNVLVAMLHDASRAEELLQDTFLQVWRKAGQFKGSGAVAAWLLRIARNKAIDAIRTRQARHEDQQSELDEVDTLLLNRRWVASASASSRMVNSAEQQVEQGLICQHIAQALERLPSEQRRCLEMAFFEGLSQREIAQQMETPLGTIKTRLGTGLDKMERWLRGIGYQRVERCTVQYV